MRAAVQRRANRRIVMRQVGDRLIPVGITSGRVHALPAEEGSGETGEGNGGNDRGSRRSRRRNQNAELNQYLGQMGLGGQDLEEVSIIERNRQASIKTNPLPTAHDYGGHALITNRPRGATETPAGGGKEEARGREYSSPWCRSRRSLFIRCSIASR